MTAAARIGAEPTAYRLGTHRVCPPEQTWARISPLFGPAGITRVADVTWLDDLGIPTAQAIRPTSLTLTVAQGKGATAAAARVSAAMESLETWHAEAVEADLAAVTPVQLARELTYDPARLPRPDVALYHPEVRLDWVAAATVRTGSPTWLPRSAVVLDCRVGDRYQPPLFRMSSNGLASGNTETEATLHGLYELLERDARTRSLAGDIARPLDLTTVDDDHLRTVLDVMSERDNAVRVLDVTAPDGVPTYWAQLFSRGLAMTFSGSGTHLDPAVALSRALTEAAQSRLTAITGSREDIAPRVYEALGRPGPLATTFRSAIAGLDRTSPVSFRRHADRTSGDLRADLDRVTALVEDLTGCEPVVARLRRPGSDLAVVRVHAPGLLFDPALDHRAPTTLPTGEPTVA